MFIRTYLTRKEEEEEEEELDLLDSPFDLSDSHSVLYVSHPARLEEGDTFQVAFWGASLKEQPKGGSVAIVRGRHAAAARKEKKNKKVMADLRDFFFLFL